MSPELSSKFNSWGEIFDDDESFLETNLLDKYQHAASMTAKSYLTTGYELTLHNGRRVDILRQ